MRRVSRPSSQPVITSTLRPAFGLILDAEAKSRVTPCHAAGFAGAPMIFITATAIIIGIIMKMILYGHLLCTFFDFNFFR